MRSDPVEILLTHNRWATKNLLDTCAALPDEQFHRSFDMGPGSLHDTVTHILGAMRGWGDMLAGREQRPRLEGEKRTPRQLLELLHEISDDMEAPARAPPPDAAVSRPRGQRPHPLTPAARPPPHPDRPAPGLPHEPPE